MTIIKSEFSLALNQVATERGISADDVVLSIEQAIIAAYKKEYSKEEEEIKVVVNKDSGEAKIFKDDKDITPPGFGRIAAQTAKQVILQKIRETQNLATSSSKLPSGCGTGTPQSYGIYFNENDDFFDIFADKDGEDDYDLTGGDCTCDGVTPTNECIARIFLPATIQISDIKINAGLLDESSPASGWVNFLVKDLSVKMNGENKANIEVETCIKSDCLTNTKKVFINSKGMTEIED